VDFYFILLFWVVIRVVQDNWFVILGGIYRPIFLTKCNQLFSYTSLINPKLMVAMKCSVAAGQG